MKKTENSRQNNIYLKTDTLLMAAFNAVAYKSTVEADAARLTIEVAGVEEMDYSYLGPVHKP